MHLDSPPTPEILNSTGRPPNCWGHIKTSSSTSLLAFLMVHSKSHSLPFSQPRPALSHPPASSIPARLRGCLSLGGKGGRGEGDFRARPKPASPPALPGTTSFPTTLAMRFLNRRKSRLQLQNRDHRGTARVFTLVGSLPRCCREGLAPPLP